MRGRRRAGFLAAKKSPGTPKQAGGAIAAITERRLAALPDVRGAELAPYLEEQTGLMRRVLREAGVQ